ncbi:MAG: hypothetical protein QOE93_1, partial [Actinomycetota bacterium]|nr:hypothetical protein [Actinomycetota bacterium]
DDKGVLTIFAVGLDPVGKDWFGALSDDPPRLVPPYDPAGSPRLHYLWGVDIQGPPPKGQTVIDQPKQAATRPTPGDRSATSTTGPGPGRGKPLTVYVAWHPHDPEGAVIGRRILTTLQGDPQRPAGERIGIPVRFRTALAGGRAPEPPTELKLDTAEPAVVAIVAGPHLLGSAPWRAWARTVRAEVQRVQVDDKVGHRLVVLATSPHALGASDLFGTIAALRLIGLDPEAQTRTALISVLAATADLLVSASAERLKIFISHAKSDGAVLAGELDQRIARAKLGAFLDSHTIVEGLQFDDVINKATGDREGATVAVVTDAYASREWCRIEALQVKRLGLPLVALDAVKSGQERSLPYLGNVPLVRDSDDREAVFDEVLIALLREVVRSRWFPGHVARLGGEQNGLLVMSRPPELLTVLHLLGENPGASSIIYPDPPLATNELAVLENAAKGPKFVTPTTLNRRTTRV